MILPFAFKLSFLNRATNVLSIGTTKNLIFVLGSSNGWLLLAHFARFIPEIC